MADSKNPVQKQQHQQQQQRQAGAPQNTHPQDSVKADTIARLEARIADLETMVVNQSQVLQFWVSYAQSGDSTIASLVLAVNNVSTHFDPQSRAYVLNEYERLRQAQESDGRSRQQQVNDAMPSSASHADATKV